MNELDLLSAELLKKYGKVLATCQDIEEREEVIVPWSPSLDLALSGGVPSGSWVSVSGPEKTGKTTSILSFCANAQKLGFFILYVNAEGRFKKMNLRIDGLDTSPDKYRLVQSEEDHILTGTEMLDIASQAIKTIPKIVVVIDSVSILAEEGETNEGMGTQSRGGGAKVLSQFCRINAQVVPVRGAIVIGIAHLICNTSGFGASLVEKESRGWKYQGDVRLRIKSSKPWMTGEKVIGLESEWLCQTSALGPPFQKVTSYIRFNHGIDRVHELVSFAVAAKLVAKNGAWFTCDFLQKHPELLEGQTWEAFKPKAKFQGQEKLSQALRDRPEWLAALEADLRQMTGLTTAEGE